MCNTPSQVHLQGALKQARRRYPNRELSLTMGAYKPNGLYVESEM